MSIKYVNTTQYNPAIHDDKHPFLVVSSKLVKDPKLTDEELGLMMRILNNSDDYVFNSSYFQAHVSSQGETRYYKSLKHLQELGYIIKKPKQGGIDWIINEIPEISLNDESSDTINNGFRLEDSNSTVLEISNPENTNCESTNREITSGESKALTNTNKSNINEINTNKRINKENNTNTNTIISTDDDFIKLSDLKSKINNALSNLNINDMDIQNKYRRVFQFEDKLFTKLNTNASGINIIEYSALEEFLNRINNVWNNSNSNKFEELTNILNDISCLVTVQFDEKSFYKLFERNFKVIPQNLITESNLILFQLYINLDDFIFENEDKLKRYVILPTDTVVIKKTKNKTNSNPTKLLDYKTRKPKTQHQSEGTIPQEKYEYFNHLITKNKEYGENERCKNLLEILNEFKQYFIEVFGADIWILIKQDKTIQIGLDKDSEYSWKTIYLYQNSRDFYLKLMDRRISEESFF